MAALVAYVDGGSHGCPGPSGIGVVIQKPDGEVIRIAKWIGHHDNNVAEYAALLEALRCALELKATSLHVYSDSEVSENQTSGHYRRRRAGVIKETQPCRKLARSFKFCISHIPRERNQEANPIANHAARSRPQRDLTLMPSAAPVPAT